MGRNQTLHLILIVLLVTGASGCVNIANSTYSDGIISFNYPSEFHMNETFAGPYVDNNFKNVAFFENSKGNRILVWRGNWNNITPASGRSNDEYAFSDVSDVLIKTEEINPNGILVDRNFISMNSGILNVHHSMYFKASDGFTYGIIICGEKANIQEINDTANLIFKTLQT